MNNLLRSIKSKKYSIIKLKYCKWKIYSGRQALEIGLIDTLGTLNDAIEYLKVINSFNEMLN